MHFILVRIVVDPEPVLEILGMRWEYNLDEMQVYNRAPSTHSFTLRGRLRIANQLISMFFGRWEETQEPGGNSGRHEDININKGKSGKKFGIE